MLTAYEAVILLAKERPGWLDVVKTCCIEAAETDQFAGAWVFWRLGRWFPSLRTLVRYGILEKVGTSRGGRRAYYRMPRREEVRRALQDLGMSPCRHVALTDTDVSIKCSYQ